MEPSEGTVQPNASGDVAEDPSVESVQATILTFVHLDGDATPKKDKSYRVIPAYSEEVGQAPYPGTPWMYLDLDIQTFYSGDMPDFTSNNEGVMRLQLDARDPQDHAKVKPASQLLKFRVRDHDYAPGFNTRGAFANVLFSSLVNLTVEVDELDQDASVIFDKVEAVVTDSGLGEIDVVQNFPYLDVGVKLMKSIVKNFGRNPDDPVWRDRMTLRPTPIAGSAFLRPGIYFLIGKKTLPDDHSEFSFVNERLLLDGKQVHATHFRFGVNLRPAV